MKDNNLKILQVNLNKNQPATENALQIAIEQSIHIIAVQEPWLVGQTTTSITPATPTTRRQEVKDYSDARSVLHQSFVQFLPKLKNKKTRPRVLIYILRSLQVQTNQDISVLDSDYIAIEIQSQKFNLNLINIYNEKDQLGTNKTTIHRVLLPNTLPPSSLLLGDFNLHHSWWDPITKNNSVDSESFIEWVEDQNLELLNKIGKGTFFRPHMDRESTIDLSFSTSNLAEKVQDWQLVNIGSDHLGILFYLQGTNREDLVDSPVQMPKYNTKKADWAKFQTVLSQSIKDSLYLSALEDFPPPSKQDSLGLLEGKLPELAKTLDLIGLELTQAIQKAAEEAIPRIKQGPQSKPWWDKELKDLRKDMNRKNNLLRKELAQSSNQDCYLWKKDYIIARNTYFQAIKSAKKNHWNQFLEKEDPSSIFKAMAYTKASKIERIPQIKSDQGVLQDSFKGKCQAFKKALFPSPPVTNPISWSSYSQSKWDWPELTREEVQRACSSKVKSSTPGPDYITQDIIIAAYKEEPEVIFQVLSILFNYGYHPSCWKQATGAILKKPAKPDYSVPKGYRVIALQNCLGKINERILAKRLSSLAEITPLLHPTQIGGRQKKSAIDAAMLLVDYIQKAKQKKYITSTIFLDVKGAFDHVSQNQLLTILKRQGLPLSLIAWVKSFLNSRQLRLAFDGEIEEFESINAGVPQGSPISPILFLIYTRDLFKGSAAFILSYIDDVSLSISSTSMKKNIKILEQEVKNLFLKGDQSAIKFDAAKTELIHFTRTKKDLPSLCLPDKSIVEPKPTIKWLGIYFDKALNFKEHIKIRTGKARACLERMSRLANSEKGLSPFAMRQLYIACITSVSDYGSQIYWNNQTAIAETLQSLQNIGLRKILGTFRTTPITPQEIEAAIPPPRVRLSSALRRYAFRALNLLGKEHPVQIAAKEAIQTSSPQQYRQLSRVVHSIKATIQEPQEQIKHFHFMPWKTQVPFTVSIDKQSKEEAAISHNLELNNLLGTENLLVIYGDASSIPKGEGVGVGLVAYDYSSLGEEIYTFQSNLGKNQIVYNGELEGITLGFEFAAKNTTKYKEVLVFADNQAAIQRIQTPSDNPGQSWQIRCLKAANKAKRKGTTIKLCWVPGHQDILGNEKADSLAKEAAKLPPSTTTTSLAIASIRTKDLAKDQWNQELQNYSAKAIALNSNTYAAKFFLQIRNKLRVPQGISREIASAFYQLKTGHGYNKAYLARIGKTTSSNCRCSSAKQTAEHLLLHCKNYNKDRRKLVKDLGNKQPSLALLLHTTKGITATTNFLETTKIGTRKWHLGQIEDEEEEEEEEEEEVEA
ncbi:reverse transcriptase domain-containing protein [Pedobacter sp.]|uniref:reverse transcriptase domain-containing protein n=1 Tax=Pedobacter sp. TaxID=1411316 RepID=UPI003D8001D9